MDIGSIIEGHMYKGFWALLQVQKESKWGNRESHSQERVWILTLVPPAGLCGINNKNIDDNDEAMVCLSQKRGIANQTSGTYVQSLVTTVMKHVSTMWHISPFPTFISPLVLEPVTDQAVPLKSLHCPCCT